MSVDRLRVCVWGAILSVASVIPSFAQVGSEWIIFNQPYFKIPVARDGIYRVDAANLQAAGLPGGIDPSRLQLFHRGVEQAIYVEGEGDGQLDTGDFIEFYGQKNDGTQDAVLYQPVTAQPHKLYNLYSDTTAYFLTVAALPGKRMASFSELNTTGLTPESYHIDEKLLLLTTQYSGGIDYGEVQNTAFELGEGWTGIQLVQTQFADYTFTNVVQTVPAGGLPEIEIFLVGRGPMEHLAEIYVGASQRLVGTATFLGFDTYTFTQTITWADIGADGTLIVRVKDAGVGGTVDRLSASYLKLRYPQNLNLQTATEKTLNLPARAGGKSYIELANPSTGLRLFDITNPASLIRIGTTSTASINAVVQTTAARKLYVTNSVIVPTVKKVSFRPIYPSQHDYIIISHPALRKPALGYSDPVKAYADYRASDAGGNYDTLVVNVQQLFDQYNYGESSPTAIYNFMRFLVNGKAPKYLLLIGKGLDVYYQYYRSPGTFSTFKDFVPSAGFPGSDIAFTAGLAGTTFEPAVPTGRIPALKSEDIANYLNKVKEMEALPYDALWRKDLLHLSGGINEGEPQQFKSYLQDFQKIAEDRYLGGKVSAVAKHSKEIQQINVAEQVNKGINLMTFFGHSSATTLDFEVGYVTDPVQGYNNKGKYPILLMNGCNAGSFFLTYALFGEDWLMAKDRGATAFIGHSAYGFVSNLKNYSEMLYRVGYQDTTFIKKGIGDIQKETARLYLDQSDRSPGSVTQAQQMVLLGDPAIKLFGATKADLEINDNNISIQALDAQPVTALTDSFAITMIIRNFGLAPKDTIRIEVLRTLNDNSTLVYDSLYPVPKYSDTLTFIVRKGREQGFGNNSFRVTIDPDNVLAELSKENNVATKSFFIPLNGTKNLFPNNFAIVNSPNVSLAFQTTDLLSAERDFLVELDTVNTFGSPFKKAFTVKGKVLARLAVTLPSSDTLAYYWRTKLAQPNPGESAEWTQSSFTYIENGPEGWAQVHFPQYLENESDGLVRDAAVRRVKFEETVLPFSVKTFGSNHPALYTDVSFKMAGAEFNFYYLAGFECRDNSINLVAFDRKSTTPYLGVKFEWFNRAGRTCGRKPWVVNNYVYWQMATGNNDDIIQYVDNVLPGDSVLLFSIGDAGYSLWPAAAKAKLGELGISLPQLNALEDGEPVIILGRKGIAPGAATVIKTTGSPKNMQELSVNKTISGGYTAGSMHSGLIGPAAEWDSLYTAPTEIEAVDQVSFDVIGVKLNGTEEVLLDDILTDQDLSVFDATEFPYLKIVFNTSDETHLTASQLAKWIVTFTPVAEGLLVYDGVADTVKLVEGEHWTGNYGFINVSDKNFTDSLTVRYDVFNQTLRTSLKEELKIKAPLPGDTTAITLKIPTMERVGLNDVDLYVNPRVLPEQHYDNNRLQLLGKFDVEVENLNPVLDVAFDGTHVSNGDFVSPNPLILVKIWDENPYILKTDTTGVRIFLTYPCTQEPCSPQQVLLSGTTIKWFAATDTSAFKLQFTPKDLPDGKYTLRVEGADARGNKTGIEPYEISVVVKREQSLIISDPYPNPFSQEVYFNVVITGETLPDQFDLKLIGVNGQLQNQFTTDDFPPFHIGRNELIWDGKSAQGNVLPNGVYIYKLIMVLDGIPVQKVGKLVLLR